MSIQSPSADWFKPPTGHERLWLGLAVSWCVVLSLMMPYWHFKGKQNSAGETYKVTPEAFVARVAKFSEANAPGTRDNFEEGINVEVPAPPGDIYMVAKQYFWYPILKLRAGETYRLHLSAVDFQHGFSLQPMNMNFQVVPGYDHVLTLTPQAPGTYPIVCNEFCGVGHHTMVGKLIVE